MPESKDVLVHVVHSEDADHYEFQAKFTAFAMYLRKKGYTITAGAPRKPSRRSESMTNHILMITGADPAQLELDLQNYDPVERVEKADGARVDYEVYLKEQPV